MSKKYKYIAFDINDFNYHKKFDKLIDVEKWIRSPENKSRKLDYLSPQEYYWLIKQPIKNKKK